MTFPVALNVSGFQTLELDRHPVIGSGLQVTGTIKVRDSMLFVHIHLRPHEEDASKPFVGFGGRRIETWTGKPVRGSASLKAHDLAEAAEKAAREWWSANPELRACNDPPSHAQEAEESPSPGF